MMKFSSSAARALHPTFFSSHPDDNEFPVDVIPPFLMDSSYSQDDGADDLPPASIPAAAVDHIVDCNDSNDKEIVIVDSNYGLSHCSVGCCLMEASGGGPKPSGTNKNAEAAQAKMSDTTASIPISSPPTVAKGSSSQKKHNNSSPDVPPALYVQSPITVDSAPIMDEFNSEVVRNHHVTFNREMFGIDENGDPITGAYVSKGITSQLYSKETYEAMIPVIEGWNHDVNLHLAKGTDPEKYHEIKDFRTNPAHSPYKNHANLYRVIEYNKLDNASKKMIVERGDLDEHTGEFKANGRIICHQGMVFQIIWEAHRRCSHKAMTLTHNIIKPKYAGVSRKLVAKFIEGCPSCLMKKKVIDTSKPITSYKFRDRFQVDFVDFRYNPKMNVYKVTMRWLLVVKDHFTGLTYLAAIPKKRVSFVAHELCVMFGLCGYPSILHTDNGTEFTSEEIVAAVKELNEQILMVTGRPRKPSDQGSVESRNKLLKQLIKSEENIQIVRGEIPNWTKTLGKVMSAVNSHQQRSAYEAVFGMKYHLEYSCTDLEMNKCVTVTD